MLTLHDATILKERYVNGAIEFVVDHYGRHFSLKYREDQWHNIPIEHQQKIKAALIRITDYWWAKGYNEQQ